MKTYLFHNPESVTQEQFEQEMLPLLPQWRKEQALRYKFLMGRVQCAAAFILLKNGLKNDFGIDEEIEFDYIANEKPILRKHPDIHFNLSHCKKGKEIKQLSVSRVSIEPNAKNQAIRIEIKATGNNTINDALTGKNGVKKLDGITYKAVIDRSTTTDAIPATTNIKLTDIKISIKGKVTYDAN